MRARAGPFQQCSFIVKACSSVSGAGATASGELPTYWLGDGRLARSTSELVHLRA